MFLEIFLSILCIFLTIKGLNFFWKFRRLANDCKHFPSHPTHMLLGNLNKVTTPVQYVHFFKDLVAEKMAKCSIFWRGPFDPCLVVLHPDTAKTILRTDDPKTLFGGAYEQFIPWLGDGLILSSGAKWERNRKLLNPAFHSDMLKSYTIIFNDVASVLIEKLQKLSGGNSIDLYQPVELATLDTVLRCAFSYKEDIQNDSGNNKYIENKLRIAELFGKRLLQLLNYYDIIYFNTNDGKNFLRLCRYVHNFSDNIIHERKQDLAENPNMKQTRRMDFLDILIKARDSDGLGLTDLEIRDEVETFIFAGHDTTGSGLAWSLYSLAKYPEFQENIYQEVETVLDGSQVVKLDHIPKLKYLSKFVKESLRMHPPVSVISRTLTKPTEFDGKVLPEGFRIDINLRQILHNPHVWPEPEAFNPERFESDLSDRNEYSFVPFSAGPRNCIGQNFALNELKVMLARIVNRFEIKLDPEHPVEEAWCIALRPKFGIKVFLKERR